MSVSCGTFNVDHLDKHPSVELLSGNRIFVNCDEGYSVNQRPQSTKCEVKCLDAGCLEGA